MTWTKLDDRYVEDCETAELSHVAFRVHTEGLVIANRLETDGVLDSIALRRLSVHGDELVAALQFLCAIEWWAQMGECAEGRCSYVILKHQDDQVESEVLAARRKNTRERVRRYRRQQAGLRPDNDDVTPLVTP
jgi:hypothetical protein